MSLPQISPTPTSSQLIPASPSLYQTAAFCAPVTLLLLIYLAFLPALALHTSFRTLPPDLSSRSANSAITAAPRTLTPPLPRSNSMAPLCSLDAVPLPKASSGTWNCLQPLQKWLPQAQTHQSPPHLCWKHPPAQSTFSPTLPFSPLPPLLTAPPSNMPPCFHQPFPPGLLPLTPATSQPSPASPLPKFAATRLNPFQ